MSSWPNKPRGLLAQGNVANQKKDAPPPLSLRTVTAKRRLMVANCAASGPGLLGKRVCSFICFGVDKDVCSSSSAYHYPARGGR